MARINELSEEHSSSQKRNSSSKSGSNKINSGSKLQKSKSSKESSNASGGLNRGSSSNSRSPQMEQNQRQEIEEIKEVIQEANEEEEKEESKVPQSLPQPDSDRASSVILSIRTPAFESVSQGGSSNSDGNSISLVSQNNPLINRASRILQVGPSSLGQQAARPNTRFNTIDESKRAFSSKYSDNRGRFNLKQASLLIERQVP